MVSGEGDNLKIMQREKTRVKDLVTNMKRDIRAFKKNMFSVLSPRM